ncbi:MAG: ribosome biogenesis GTPase Der [Candidatus Cloacimonetes bacterium]|nr:ribosome biogenesis GTPase Der [Candidatus Cloacimonadota bacterium]
MRKNIVAIVGSSNVGKSTLFNRICHRRSAIVDFKEGSTRDRRYEDAEWNGHYFTVVDTGGILPKSRDNLDRAVKLQAEMAIAEADLILFLVDTKVGATAVDKDIARILYPQREKVILVANKVDSDKDKLEIYDFLQLGLGEAFPVAAIQGRNVGNLLDKLIELLPHYSEEPETEEILKIAIVGKPNVGKSSVLNRLTGKNDSIIDPKPGTTRDTVDTRIRYHGKPLLLIDTAGLRRKGKVDYGVEYFSVVRTIEAIERAHLVLLVLDATQEIATQDQKIASYVWRRFKDTIILVNKWDLIHKDNATPGEFIVRIREQLPFLQYCPVMFVSALTGQRIHRILERIMEVTEESRKRITTAELNRFLNRITIKYAPSHSSGKHARIFFGTQIKTSPPVFVFFCNNPQLITTHYRRYLNNQLREEFGFSGTAFKIFFRGRNESKH